MYIIINPHACLTANKNILVFLTLTHTNYLSERQQHFALSSLSSFPCTTLSLSAISLYAAPTLILLVRQTTYNHISLPLHIRHTAA